MSALIAFAVTTFFNVLAADDSKQAAEASRDSAKSSAESVALEKTPTLLTTCTLGGENADIPNAPTPLRLLISRDPNNKFIGSRTSITDADPSDVTPAPKTFEWCHLFNYGRLPVVNVHLTFDVVDRSVPRSFDYLTAPENERYRVYIPSVPANSEQSFRIINMGPTEAAPVRENQASYQVPPDYAPTTAPFPEQSYDGSFLKPNTRKVTHP